MTKNVGPLFNLFGLTLFHQVQDLTQSIFQAKIYLISNWKSVDNNVELNMTPSFLHENGLWSKIMKIFCFTIFSQCVLDTEIQDVNYKFIIKLNFDCWFIGQIIQLQMEKQIDRQTYESNEPVESECWSRIVSSVMEWRDLVVFPCLVPLLKECFTCRVQCSNRLKINDYIKLSKT